LNSAESHAGGSVRDIPLWTLATPLIGGVLAAAAVLGVGGYFAILVGLGLAGIVFAAVHHAEIVAHRIEEPYGTLVVYLFFTCVP